jgi:hypothetical protein
MPRLSLWFIRAALLYLLFGFTFGALLLAQKGISYAPSVWNLFPIHIEFLSVGWLVQLAMGVGFWIFPRFSNRPPRGNERLIWLSFVSINVGILLTAFQLWVSSTLLLGRVLEVSGAVIYVLGLWRRVKPHGV